MGEQVFNRHQVAGSIPATPTIRKKMKRLLLIFTMMATWIVVSCSSTAGCFGHWVKGPGPQRGSRDLNRDAKLPYYQCVDENNKGSNLERRSSP